MSLPFQLRRGIAPGLVALLQAACAAVPGAQTPPRAERSLPNVVILVADDLGRADVGYRSDDIRTPNIDRLATEGIRLERFYVASLCSPTRAGLMTGRYPHRFGMGQGVVEPTRRHGLPPEEETIAELLARAGYARRMALGKWHLGHSSTRYHPLNQGFAHFYGHYNGAIDYFTHQRNGELDWHRDYESSYDQGYSTDLLAEEAVRFIAGSPRDEPFLLYLAFNAVHSPMQAKREHLDLHGYRPEGGAFREGTGGSQAGERRLEQYGRNGNGNTIRQTYLGMLSGLDDGIGRVLDALEERGVAENTLVLFLSDNGGTPRFGGSNRPLRGDKGSEYEGGVRVNAVVRWPARLRGGRSVDHMLSYVDILPTLRGVVGISDPPARALDGVDALGVLAGGDPPDRVVYLGKDAVATRRWKLINGELYDLARDPRETQDVATAHPDTVARLRTRLEAFQALAGPPTETGRFETPPEWKIPDHRERSGSGEPRPLRARS